MKLDDAEIDRQHCIAIVHEYQRCRDSFTLFESAATQLIMGGKNRLMSYRAYNAYASFILHLYEFLVALHARDLNVTEITKTNTEEKHERLDKLIHSSISRVVRNRIDRIEQGTAPRWENDLSTYQALWPVSPNFASEFRRMRNKVGGHVTYQRAKEIDLTAFYQANHSYLYMLYRDCGDWWAPRGDAFPELDQITDFFGSIVRELHPDAHK
ncbi:hypothetical protein ACIPEN_03005 [Herbaspirillum chlorophenolicum]|uniref:HEPN AbiU2-like domain-containing protein n=1 Tax=Herbaspirillum chlorophenolicum TaxID=211589 RepID=A0ABW8ETY8_9BURK